MFEKFRDIKLSPYQERLWKTLVFLVRLLILSIPIYLVLAFANLLWLQYLVADQSVRILNILGFSVAQNGTFLTAGDFVFLISPDCTGWKSALFLFALIFAVPSPLFRASTPIPPKQVGLCGHALASCKKRASKNHLKINTCILKRRLIGLGIGLPLVWIGNLTRIAGVVAAESAWGLETAMLIHDYLWQIGLVLVVLIIWVFWLKWIQSENRLNLKQINTNI